MANSWFRMYSELLNDPKVQNLPPELFKIWVNTLCIACNNNGTLPKLEDVSFALRETVVTVSSAFHALENVTLLVTVGETFQVPSWRKRQYKSDVSTNRVRKFRNGCKTVSETPPDTDTDTDTDTDKKEKEKDVKETSSKKIEKKIFIIPDWIPKLEWEAWLEVRKSKRAGNGDHALGLAVRKLEEFARLGNPPMEVLNQSIMRGYVELFEIKTGGNGYGKFDSPHPGKGEQAKAAVNELLGEMGIPPLA